MNFKEAMKAAVEGKEIRRRGWSPRHRLSFNSCGCLVDQDGGIGDLFCLDIENDDWEIYQPEYRYKTVPELMSEGWSFNMYGELRYPDFKGTYEYINYTNLHLLGSEFTGSVDVDSNPKLEAIIKTEVEK